VRHTHAWFPGATGTPKNRSSEEFAGKVSWFEGQVGRFPGQARRFQGQTEQNRKNLPIKKGANPCQDCLSDDRQPSKMLNIVPVMQTYTISRF
jgi:hypothetical protein